MRPEVAAARLWWTRGGDRDRGGLGDRGDLGELSLSLGDTMIQGKCHNKYACIWYSSLLLHNAPETGEELEIVEAKIVRPGRDHRLKLGRVTRVLTSYLTFRSSCNRPC